MDGADPASRRRGLGLCGGQTDRKNVTREEDIPAIIDQLCEQSDASMACLRTALARYLRSGEKPDAEARAAGQFAYPELRVDYRSDQPVAFPTRAFGRLDPRHPSTKTALDAIAATVDDIPEHQLRA